MKQSETNNNVSWWPSEWTGSPCRTTDNFSEVFLFQVNTAASGLILKKEILCRSQNQTDFNILRKIFQQTMHFTVAVKRHSMTLAENKTKHWSDNWKYPAFNALIFILRCYIALSFSLRFSYNFIWLQKMLTLFDITTLKLGPLVSL